MNRRTSRELNETETGIYVVCDDESLLKTINTMLKRKGIIGVTDSVGKVHYVVDARANPGYAARRIHDLVTDISGDDGTKDKVVFGNMQESVLNAIIEDVLLEHRFEPSLLGTRAIFILVKNIAIRESTAHLTPKQLFDNAAQALEISYNHVERNIRYSIYKSDFSGRGVKSISVVRILAAEVTKRAERVMAKK